MEKEYGGFLELDEFSGNEFYKGAVELNCGRSCLAYLLLAGKIKKLYIPYFLCGTVRMCCEAYGVDYEYYPITEDFEPVLRGAGKYDAVYAVNFYGQLSASYLTALKRQYPRLIIDNSQAFFNKPLPGTDTMYICRKFFGVPDGAYLYTDKRADIEIKQDIACDRMTYLLGRYEKTAQEYYAGYVKNNEYFDNMKLLGMSKITKNILKAIDYDSVKDKRTRNYMELHRMLSEYNQIQAKPAEGAFAYPFLAENADGIRKELIKKKIYIPILWPDVLSLCHRASVEYKYACGILPLPVDQRYSAADMRYIADEIIRRL